MGCLGNSKTTEDTGVDEKERREANKKIEKQLQKERLAYKATHRLLLLGKGAPTPGPQTSGPQDLRTRLPRDAGLHSPEAGQSGPVWSSSAIWAAVGMATRQARR